MVASGEFVDSAQDVVYVRGVMHELHHQLRTRGAAELSCVSNKTGD